MHAEPSYSFVRDTCQDQMSEGTFVDGRLCSHLARLSLFTRTVCSTRPQQFGSQQPTRVFFFFSGYCTAVNAPTPV